MKENVGFIKNWCYDNEKKIFVSMRIYSILKAT